MSYVLETKHQPSHFGGSLRHKLAWFGGMVTAWPIPADYVCTLNNTPMLRKLHASSGQCTRMCYGPEKVWSLDKWSSLLAFMGNFRLHPHVLPSELRSCPLLSCAAWKQKLQYYPLDQEQGCTCFWLPQPRPWKETRPSQHQQTSLLEEQAHSALGFMGPIVKAKLNK